MRQNNCIIRFSSMVVVVVYMFYLVFCHFIRFAYIFGGVGHSAVNNIGSIRVSIGSVESITLIFVINHIIHS